MSEALIRAQIKTILEGVTGIGIVHDYERHPPAGVGALLQLMLANGITNGWTIHRGKTSSKPATMGSIGVSRQIERIHIFKIAGIMECDDFAGSLKIVQACMDAIFDAFKVNPTINGTANSHDHFQIDSIETIKVIYEDQSVGDRYHISEGTLTVYERVV
jgi:hypothetical protein